MAQSTRKTQIKPLILLFLGAAALAFFTSHATLSVDPPNRYLVAKSIVDHQDLKMRFIPAEPTPPGADLGRDGNYYSRFSIGQPLIFAGPYYLCHHLLGIQSDKLIRSIISLTVFPLTLALTALVFYFLLGEFGINRRRCYLAAVLLVFATGLWQLSKEGQEDAHLALFYAAAAWFLRRYQNTASLKALAASALAVAAAFLTRSDAFPTVICYLIFAFYLIRQNHPTKLAPDVKSGDSYPLNNLAPDVKSGDSYPLNNLAPDVKSGDSLTDHLNSKAAFSNKILWLPYFLVLALTLPALLIHMYITYSHFGHPFVGQHNPFSLSFLPRGLMGLLFSPGKSLFLYNPIFFLALPGFIPLWRLHRPWTLFIVSAFIGCLLLHAAVDAFHGNCTWGPRYLCRQFPLLFIPVAFFAFYPPRLSLLRKTVVALIAAFSLLVQIAAVSLHHNREIHELALAYNVSWSQRQWTMFEPQANFLKIRLTNLKNSLHEMKNHKIAPWPTTPNHLLSPQQQLNAPTLHYLAFWPFHLTYYLPAVKPNLALPLWAATLILLIGVTASLSLLYLGYRKFGKLTS